MGPSRMALSKPLIAAVSGYAVAGGLELALLADLRVVEEDAVFGVFCRRWGVPLIDGGTVRLPRVVGHGRAMDLILTGRPVHADEALQMGLANRVVPVGESLTVAHRLAEEIAAFPQRACARTGHPPLPSGTSRSPTPCEPRVPADWKRSWPKASPAPTGSPPAKAATASSDVDPGALRAKQPLNAAS